MPLSASVSDSYVQHNPADQQSHLSRCVHRHCCRRMVTVLIFMSEVIKLSSCRWVHFLHLYERFVHPSEWHHQATSRQIITWSCLLIADIDMSTKKKCHGAKHVRSAHKVTVNNKLLCPISNNNIKMSVTVYIPQGCLSIADTIRQRTYSLECKSEFQNSKMNRNWDREVALPWDRSFLKYISIVR